MLNYSFLWIKYQLTWPTDYSLLLLLLLWNGGTLWHLQHFLQCSKYIIVELTPLSFSIIPLSPIAVIVKTSLIFPFTYMYTQYLYHIHHPIYFPHAPPHWFQSWRQNTFCLPVLKFCNRKNIFALFKVAMQGVSL
jgi:hypothetical protein